MKVKTQIQSTVPTGTAPLSVASNTTVPNLSSEKWNGQNLPSISANAGKVLAVNSGNSALEWASVGGAGTVTSIIAGTGLTGGTITTSGTIAANIGTASGQVAAGDHTHAALYQPLNATLNAVAAGTYTGDDSITTLGIVTAGTWNATTITVARGGTGSTSAAGARTNLETPKVFISATQPTATNIGDIWFIP